MVFVTSLGQRPREVSQGIEGIWEGILQGTEDRNRVKYSPFQPPHLENAATNQRHNQGPRGQWECCAARAPKGISARGLQKVKVGRPPQAQPPGSQARALGLNHRDAQGSRPAARGGAGGHSGQATHLLPHPGHLAGRRGAARRPQGQPSAPAPTAASAPAGPQATPRARARGGKRWRRGAGGRPECPALRRAGEGRTAGGDRVR